MKDWLKKIKDSAQNRSGLLIIIVAAVLIEVISAIQSWYAAEGIRREVQRNAKNELRMKGLEIKNIMTAVEVAVNNLVWDAEQQLSKPDDIMQVCRRLVEANDMIVGSGIGFIPGYYPEQGRWYEPYVKRREDGTLVTLQIGSASHDYTKAEWFTGPLTSDKGHWSEPYFDEAGAGMSLCTYSYPIRDKQGKTVAVIGADLSLGWLSEVINRTRSYPSSYNLLLSRTGKLIACPEESLTMRKTVQEVTKGMSDSMAQVVNRRMLDGEQGQAVVYDNNGNKNYVFFAPVEGETGWSMSVVCSDKEIFHTLRWMNINLLVLTLIGLALLSLIIFRSARNTKRLQAFNSEKERIAGELHIANAIQMGMLPKTFPPYPERDDIEIFGSLVSAKEVGGDLYDFYIRDEKLLFCIGDVSGKGIPASLVMAVTRSMFHLVAAHESAPDRILHAMNNTLTEMNESNMFVTLFVGVLDLPTGRLRYSNAGHCPPLLIGQGVGLLPTEANIPVGLTPDWKFVAQEQLIHPGTTIFLYTDGVVEAENARHELYSEQRMLREARRTLKARQHNPEQLIRNMTQSISDFVDGAEQSDDLTMLAIQFTKEKRDVRLKRVITLPNDVQTIPQLKEFVDGIVSELSFDADTAMSLNLALEEAVVNVMSYAYPPGTTGDIAIEAEANDVRLKFTITDSGAPFDPTAKEDTDITLSAEERPIGGLGIFLVRQLMDSINYERIDGKNILSLRKKLTTAISPTEN